jgi:hypothetical protein
MEMGDDPFTEDMDDEQMLTYTYGKLDINEIYGVSIQDVNGALRRKSFAQHVNFQETMEKELGSEFRVNSFHKFKQAMQMVPRIRGKRIQWANSLNLDSRLARLLPPGILFDELSGIKSMDETQIENILSSFFQEVKHTFIAACEQLGQIENVQQAKVEIALNKFTGDIGKFGDTGMFQEGLENQIGSPDPYILKAIFHEHVLAEDSVIMDVTSNYKILFSNKQEYARLFGHPDEYRLGPDSKLEENDLKDNPNIPVFLMEVAKGLHNIHGTDKNLVGPSMADLKDLQDGFAELKKEYERILEDNNNVFPGECNHVQRCMQLTLVAADSASAKTLHAKLSKHLNEQLLDGKVFARKENIFVDTGFPPSDKQFNIMIFAPLSFFDGKNDKEFEKMLSQEICETEGLDRSDLVFIYCASKLQSNGNLVDISQDFDASLLSQVSGLDRTDPLKAHMDQINSVFDPAGGKSVVLLQGRKRISLQELMSVPEVIEAGLRVEEAVQAYQYTGPLFQVIFHMNTGSQE